MSRHFTQTTQNKGFTLIEIMVSLALFAVVAVVAIGAFLKIIDANRRSEAIETAINDANFALESMVRDLRVGSDYQCTSSLPTVIPSPSIGNSACASLAANQILAFNSAQTAPTGFGGTCNLIHAYELSGSVIQKAEQTACGASYSFVPVTSTSSDLTIQTFDVKIDGAPTAVPSVQPKVFILLSGFAGQSQEDRTSFTVQTSASQRIME